jgi:hypothetical protein
MVAIVRESRGRVKVRKGGDKKLMRRNLKEVVYDDENDTTTVN